MGVGRGTHARKRARRPGRTGGLLHQPLPRRIELSGRRARPEARALTILCRLNPAHGPKLFELLQSGLADEDVLQWTAADDPARVDIAVVHRMPQGFLKPFVNLRLVSGIGAGIDHVSSDPDLPPDIAIVRVIHPDFAAGMGDYVLCWVLFHHRDVPGLLAAQRQRAWSFRPSRPARDVAIGVLGLGQMGATVATRLAAIGYDVHAWSRTPRQVADVRCHHGADGLTHMLGAIEILVNLLPLTPATQAILDRRTFAALRPGSVLISAGRGEHLVVDDLVAALSSGQLRAATIDAFPQEPLPDDHPLWRAANIYVTPHCASTASAEMVAGAIIANVKRFRAGEPLVGAIDRRRGY